jgi:peroxiredoxin
MIRYSRYAIATGAVLGLAGLMAMGQSPVAAQAVVGQPAPAFSLPDSKGGTQSLGSFAGKLVVLEWVNPDCPFVKKHYGSGNMQKLQKAYTSRGVAWLTVNSSAPGKQGHLEAATAEAFVEDKGASPTALLLDPQGKVGRAYGAKTTPHMFVIDASGKLIYNGAIDDNPSADPADVATATNYVRAALDEALSGKPVTTAATQPYGCSVKY